MEPRLEPIRVAEGPEVAPRGDQRGLDGVLGDIGVAQDAGGNRHASVSGRAGQGIEGVTIPLLCALDECDPRYGLHLFLNV